MGKLTIAIAASLVLGGTAMLLASDQGTIQPGNPGATVAAGLDALPELAGSFGDMLMGGNAFSPNDLENLVRIDGGLYQVEFSPEISQDPIASSVITKVEGGRVSSVNVVHTNSGIYSTDGLVSNHVQYHGVTVRRLDEIEFGLPLAFAWLRGYGWTSLPKNGSGAVVYMNDGNVSTLVTGDRTHACVRGDNTVTCI